MRDVLDTMIGSSAAASDPKAAADHFAKAKAAEMEGDREAALVHLRKASQLGEMPEYRFRLAYHLDLVGEEDEALAIYEDLAATPNPPVNVFLNLAVLYEDRGDISRAERCLRQILESNPNHLRARLYMKDVLASRDMYYDEEHQRDVAKHNALLDTPVTDFELSVRARNCLKKMNIRTLGDLLKVSEAELMSYKNFGETSLHEIKYMLTHKGLRLGQGLEGHGRIRREVYEQLKGKASEAVLNKPISVLDLSVRARKALQMLNIQTLGDLATRTEAELMGVKNFGATSLVEVKEKLVQHNLDLRTLD
ncbi:MAG: DNA-directed RNA polymerase subunit alpha C-terminal domain-containing protein [Phycisphaerales bacterium]